VQVVRARPHVGEDQRPEVHDRQPVRIHRATDLLGHVVIHHAQEARGQEKPHRVMAVPPLDHRVLHARISRVRLHEACRNGGAVHDVQQRHRQDECAIEPVGHVDVPHLASGQRAEEHDGVGHPHQRDQDVDRPFELCIFLARGVAQRQGHCSRQNHQLPSPEREGRQRPGKQPRLTGALHRVIAGGKERTAAEREDHRIGVQRAQSPVGQPGNVEVQGRKGQLCGDPHAHQHADHAPDHGHDGELPDHGVVVGRLMGPVLLIHVAPSRAAAQGQHGSSVPRR
jgi:hypothetical protein